VGVRLIFENSTAYRKSVPTDLSSHFLFAEVGYHLVHYEIRDLLARVDQVSSAPFLGCPLSIC
jgi:hypothetical protein